MVERRPDYTCTNYTFLYLCNLHPTYIHTHKSNVRTAAAMHLRVFYDYPSLYDLELLVLIFE
jgi:hypothetical protein